MYANNRLGKAPKAVFRTAGGSIYTYAHPKLAGQLLDSSKGSLLQYINEVDITASLRLNDTYFNAQPLQDNAVMEVMVDGSTITVTNHVMAGRATLQVTPGSGLVRDGDLTAIAPFIASSKDAQGGVITRRRFTSAGAMTRIYYGVSFANFPHDVDVGNAVAIYPMVMLYGGWIEGIIGGDQISETLWAVGNLNGIQGSFKPFNIAGVGEVNIGGDTAGNSQIDDETSTPLNDAALGNITETVSEQAGIRGTLTSVGRT